MTKKEKIVEELKDKFSRAKAIVFAKFHGLSVGKISEFRKQVRESNADYTVAKKSLIKIAAKESGKELYWSLSFPFGENSVLYRESG